MALSTRLQFKQAQSLVMTPQLMQSIRLLQMGHLELTAHIAREIEQNPLLDTPENSGPDNVGDGPAEAPLAPSDLGDIPLSTLDGIDTWMSGGMETDASTMAENLGTTLENTFERDETGRRADEVPAGFTASGAAMGVDPWKSVRGGGGDDDNAWEQASTAPQSLAEYLCAQIAHQFRNEGDRALACFIAWSLDEDGYFRADPADAARDAGVSVSQLESVLKQVQQLDPPGVGARDLKECLAIQLQAQDRFDPAIAAMISNLELLAHRDFARLMKLCGVDREDLADMVAEIRALDPRPGGRFGGNPTQSVIADVIVLPTADGGWSVELNPEALPRVIVNRRYHREVMRVCKQEKDREFVNECLASANWLTKSLDQRAQTILKVASEIVKQQDAFLALGAGHLRPLNLRTVADAIKMHESTVSRVTSNKYMLTHRGLFELKFFFSQALASTSGAESHSAETVRHRIRQLIDAEPVDAILSDDAIVENLNRSGIEIARRTVAKYREAMQIPSSVQRRREKQGLLQLNAS